MVEVQWLGEIAYVTAWEQQKSLVAARNSSPHLVDKLLLLEHPPTYTLGRRGDLDHLLLDEESLAQQGIDLFWVDRGGAITYHGPGQVVGYPILNLKRLHGFRGLPRPDLHRYLRDIEEVVIQALATFAIEGWRYEGYTGVWVDTATGPAKIAAIGIRVSSKGISSHGFALNVAPDLSHFAQIVPCGIREHGVTSMVEVLKRPLTSTDLIDPLIAAFQAVFQVETTPVSAYNG